MKEGARKGGPKRKVCACEGGGCKRCRQRAAGRSHYERYLRVDAIPATDEELDRRAQEWLERTQRREETP